MIFFSWGNDPVIGWIWLAGIGLLLVAMILAALGVPPTAYLPAWFFA